MEEGERGWSKCNRVKGEEELGERERGVELGLAFRGVRSRDCVGEWHGGDRGLLVRSDVLEAG